MNDEGLVAIHLYGPLADKYGARHDFAIDTPAEALAALNANYPGFANDFLQTEIYYIHADGEWREGGETGALRPVGQEVHFYPQIEGRGQLVGLGLTALFPALSATAATILGNVIVAGALIGLSLLFKPKAAKQQKDKAKSESYAFNGPENVTEQGVAVPLVYGRVHAGSVVISAGLEVNDEPANAAGDLNLPGGGALHPDNAPAFPGGFPNIVGDGANKHPNGWVIHTTDPDENAKIWKPTPQPIPGWFYWYWKVDKSFSPDGFFVTRGVT